jgi:lipopolysaccharide assembly outer membrane protein LptD (OstA)
MAMRREKVTLMKSVPLAMCLITASAFAQDRPTALEITDRGGQRVYMRAKSIQRDQADPTIVRLKGDVRIAAKNANQKNGVMSVKADEAVYHFDTGEIEPLGNVSVKLTQ